jgi:hypothetical protein
MQLLKATCFCVLSSICVSAMAHGKAVAHSPHPQETIRVYENGHLVKKFVDNSGKPLVLHMKERKAGRPRHETIRIQEKLPRSRGREVIHFYNQGGNINNRRLFDDIMQDQRTETVLMQQYFNHMQSLMHSEMQQFQNEDQMMRHNRPQKNWHLYRGKHLAPAKIVRVHEEEYPNQLMPSQSAEHKKSDWWKKFKSHF